MANPSSRWDLVPVYGVYLKIDDTPSLGTVTFTLNSRITRDDGRIIYPDGATKVARVGVAEDQNSTVRSTVRAAWRAADQAANIMPNQAGAFDGTAWDTWWDDVVVPAAVFTSFPAVDDPDIVQAVPGVTVREQLQSGGGKQYTITPLLSHLDLTIPGINLGTIEVPPGSPSVPAPMYAKGIPGGIAGLDADGDVVDADGVKVVAGAAAVSSVAGKTGAVSLVKGDVGLGNVTNTADMDKPVSVAQGDAIAAAVASKADLVGGVIPTAQLPAIAISEFLGPVVSQSAMLALTGQKGDWAYRTDTGARWVITGNTPSSLSSWTVISEPGGAVASVNGSSGVVVLGAADVGASPVGHTHTAANVTDFSTAVLAVMDYLNDQVRDHTHYVIPFDSTSRAFGPIPTPWFGGGTDSRPWKVVFDATKDLTYDHATEAPNPTSHPLLDDGDDVLFFYVAP